MVILGAHQNMLPAKKIEMRVIIDSLSVKGKNAEISRQKIAKRRKLGSCILFFKGNFQMLYE
jgi:hypothetical protein